MKHSLAAMLALAALTAAPPAAAQSDNTGGLITGSEVARTPAVPTRDLEGALFRNAGGRTAFRSRAIADAMTGETGAVCTGGLERPEHWPRALEPDPAAECVVCTLLRRPGLQSDEAQAALRALRGGAPGRPGDPAEVLVAALAGLADERPGFVDERGRYVDGAHWQDAIVAYEAYMDSAPDEVLDSPPPVLVAIAIIMDRVVDAGLAAAER